MTPRKFFKAEWFWGRETDIWLKNLLIGYTLNFPCGMSQIGDVRADKDSHCKPDIIADIRAPEVHFKKGEFETLLCDPPFSFWALHKIYSWFPDVLKLAKRRAIFRAPLVKLTPPKQWRKWHREYYIVVYGESMTLNMFHVFTNQNDSLDKRVVDGS